MANRFPNGVTWYQEGKATIHVYFPEGDVACTYCKLLSQDNIRRYMCLESGELIPEPEYMIGRLCPMKLKDKRRNEE